MRGLSGRVAVLGIGSNSVRLLIAELSGKSYATVERRETVTGLAGYESAFGGAPLLTARPIADTAQVASRFARHAEEQGASLTAVIATEAVRRAANSGELIDDLGRRLKVPVTIVSGEEEARLGWLAVSSSYSEGGTPVGVIDIGGGSTETSVGHSGRASPSAVLSLQAGSRTLMRRFGLQRKVEPTKMIGIMSTLAIELADRARQLEPRPQTCVVIGGTASVLQAVLSAAPNTQHPAPDGQSAITRSWLAGWLARMSVSDQDARVEAGVPKDRADVIVAGGAVLLTLIDAWGVGEFRVSERNILDGYLADSGEPAPSK